MRSKEQILKHLEKSYNETPGSYDKLIISQNVLLEILVDIRDEVAKLTQLLGILEKKTYGTG